MKIERFEVPGLAQYSYVISSSGQAVVIDAMRDIEPYTAYAVDHDLRISHILETHIHADFAAGSAALAELTGAELCLSAHDHGQDYQYTMPHRALHDGDVIDAGGLRLRALHTPGHTPEHLSFIVFDGDRSATTPAALFSGDFLFVGSVGRPDLLGETAKQGLAHELFRSLHQRIASLPDGVHLYPGHGAGSLCGSGMSDRAESTLGYERSTNQLFALSEDAFVSAILASVPPMPTYYPRMKALNSKGACALPSLPGDTPLHCREVEELLHQEDVIILDLRRPEAFGGAHIPGAINIGAGQNLSLWAGWMLAPGRRIILVNDQGDDEASRRALVRVGLDHIEGFLAKGMPAWIDAGLDFEGTQQLSARQVDRRPPDAKVVDVRSNREWDGGHIEGAQHIMLGELPEHLAKLPRDRPLIAVCGSGYRSSIAASLLTRDGFVDVSSMDGGMAAWVNLQLPTSRL